MTNFFDQFDGTPGSAPSPAPAGPSAGGNFFDQFDAPQAAAKPSLRPMTPQEEQSFLAAAKAAGSGRGRR